jgi:hypothetical protein
MGIAAYPALAKPVPSQACERVQFYVFNGLFSDDLYIDVANWTTATRATIFSLGPGQGTSFSLEPGVFEIYIVNWGNDGSAEVQLGDMIAYAACTKVGLSVKGVTGEPVLDIHSVSLER